jgi:hypothetical protein
LHLGDKTLLFFTSADRWDVVSVEKAR